MPEWFSSPEAFSDPPATHGRVSILSLHRDLRRRRAPTTNNLPPSQFRRTDAEVARVRALCERKALIGPITDDDDTPDPVAEGCLIMLRYLCGQLDEVSLIYVLEKDENGEVP